VLGALLIGYWERGKLIYTSHVGSIRWQESRTGRARLDALRTEKCPFTKKPTCIADNLGRAKARRRVNFKAGLRTVRCVPPSSCVCATISTLQ
jgi:hypothetical protein